MYPTLNERYADFQLGMAVCLLFFCGFRRLGAVCGLRVVYADIIPQNPQSVALTWVRLSRYLEVKNGQSGFLTTQVNLMILVVSFPRC